MDENKKENNRGLIQITIILAVTCILLLCVTIFNFINLSQNSYNVFNEEMSCIPDYFKVKYLESKGNLVFNNKNRKKYGNCKINKNGTAQLQVKFDKLYKDEYVDKLEICIKYKTKGDRYKIGLKKCPGEINCYTYTDTKAQECYFTIYGDEESKLNEGIYTFKSRGDVSIKDVAVSKIETSMGTMYDTGFSNIISDSDRFASLYLYGTKDKTKYDKKNLYSFPTWNWTVK